MVDESTLKSKGGPASHARRIERSRASLAFVRRALLSYQVRLNEIQLAGPMNRVCNERRRTVMIVRRRMPEIFFVAADRTLA